MRFRLTVFLLLANAVLLFLIWSFDGSSERASGRQAANRIVDFSYLEISGKNVDKPRVLKFENNQWRIVSPIEWKANLFAVNRIKTQIEFLDRQTSFSFAEALRAGHSPEEYGLNDPLYVLRFGSASNTNTIKIGKSTALGGRFYLLDESADSVVVVDGETVDSLIQDMERLRDQTVFNISKYEISAFSVRFPVSKNDAEFRRVGLVKESGSWRFETPIVAPADAAEVDAFLNDLSKLVALNFSVGKKQKTGFELFSLPWAITLQGLNKREVLLLGETTDDGKQVFARFENNPTIFAVDASILGRIEHLQTTLRDKVVLRTSPSRITGIDISENGRKIGLRKVKDGNWEVIAQNGKTVLANLALVNKLLLKLEAVRAQEFVADNARPSEYGINADSLKISVIDGNSEKPVSISIGSAYKAQGKFYRRYATVDGRSVFGIGLDLPNLAVADALQFRNALVASLDGAEIESLKIENLETAKTVFEVAFKDGKPASPLSKRDSDALRALVAFARNTVAGSWTGRAFNETGVEVDKNKIEKWNYALTVRYLPKSAQKPLVRRWLLTKRIGATVQYCSVGGFDALFFPEPVLINAFFELSQEKAPPPQLDNPEPVAPQKK